MDDLHADGAVAGFFCYPLDTPVSYTHLDVYKRQALMEECLHDVEQAAYHPHKPLNQAIAQHLMQGDLQENLGLTAINWYFFRFLKEGT